MRRAMEIYTVKKYSEFLPDSHQVSGLPLFDWRQAVVRSPVSRAGAFVMRRYRVHPDIAELVASCAGIGSVADR